MITGYGHTNTRSPFLIRHLALKIIELFFKRSGQHVVGRFLEVHGDEVLDLCTSEKQLLELKKKVGGWDLASKVNDANPAADHTFASCESASRAYRTGLKLDKRGEGGSNKESSRSHIIFTLYASTPKVEEAGCVHIVDFAGHEFSPPQWMKERQEELWSNRKSTEQLINFLQTRKETQSKELLDDSPALLKVLSPVLTQLESRIMIIGTVSMEGSVDDEETLLKLQDMADLGSFSDYLNSLIPG